MTKTELIFNLERQIELNQSLSQYEEQLLQTLIYNIDLDKKQAVSDITKILGKNLSTKRFEIVVKELNNIFSVVNNKLQLSIEESIPEIYLQCTKYHAQTLSLFDSLPVVNNIADITFKTIFGNEINQIHFTKWIESIYQKPVDDYLKLKIAENIDSAYPKIVKELKKTLQVSDYNLTTLVRTFVQGVNTKAMTDIYKQNPDYLINDTVIWSAVLENGFRNEGRGTCLRCAGLDGNEYKLDEHPPIPLHPRCRCVLLPKTKSWSELGLDNEKINERLRAYSLRENKNIDKGGRRKILDAGQVSDNDYGNWITKQSETIQIQTLGIKRYELLKSGKTSFNDLVDKKTGELIPVKELVYK